jgi:hypothetical protein
MGFFRELNRRNVYKVAVAYAVVGGRESLFQSINVARIMETVRGQREHAGKCSGAHGNHQEQA